MFISISFLREINNAVFFQFRDDQSNLKQCVFYKSIYAKYPSILFFDIEAECFTSKGLVGSDFEDMLNSKPIEKIVYLLSS